MVEKGIQFVEVSVESDYIPGKHEGGVDYNGKSLQNAFISQIAYTFQLSGEDEKNCYRFDRRSTVCTFCKICIPDGRDRVIRWCNAPEYVRVSVKNGEGKEVEARATCSGDEVTGNCPNECLYKLGPCFE